jgi:indolepyruvate ferredoxin oxidoreductase beta subunit
METRSIMIVGVGGQGTLLASRILGNAVISQGYDVKVSEVHGMSQRGGSVVTYVRYGEKVHSPIIDKGGADMILAFELLEAKRALPFLKKDGKIIVNTQEIDPMPVIIGSAEYPSDVLDELANKGLNIDAIDALSPAIEAGSSKAVNIVLMGCAAKYFDIPKERWISAIEKTVNPKFVEMNKVAFELGYNS